MSNETTQEAPTINGKSELDILKAQADRMGISYKANISLTTLKAKIQLVQDGESLEPEASRVDNTTQEDKAAEVYQEAMKLVRVQITPLDTNKATNYDCDFFTAGNSVVGNVTRNIPFGRPWHVEQILVNAIKEKTYQQFTTKKNAQGADVVTKRNVPAYSVVELPPLSAQELKDLADLQARTNALEDE
ncbi:MAG: hypothetical protein RR575_00150 [Acinetobacter sp.]